MSVWSRLGLSLFFLASPGRCSREQKAVPDAAPETVVVDAGPPAPSPPRIDPAVQANAIALERARTDLADVQWLVAHNVTSNPARTDGEVASKCDANASAVAKLGPASAPELRETLEQTRALCAFDVPLVTAKEALDQLANVQSQASRRLSCNVARTELEKARQVKPRDIKLLRLDGRREPLCNKYY